MLYTERGKLLAQQALKNAGRELLALVVPHADHQDFAIVSEEVVIVDFARDKAIGSCADGIAQ